MGAGMANEKAYVAQVRQHGETYHYYGATAEQALLRARARTYGPLWDAIAVFKMPEPKANQMENEHGSR
jgi:hypothetical protein